MSVSFYSDFIHDVFKTRRFHNSFSKWFIYGFFCKQNSFVDVKSNEENEFCIHFAQFGFVKE